MTQLLVSAGMATGVVMASSATAADCNADTRAAGAMVNAEYAFAARAQSSVREAFLAYLAPDALILQPTPIPGIDFYKGLKESPDALSWYPTTGGLAAGGDLGFTTGPWVYTPAAGGKPSHGDFVTVWKVDAECRWQVAFDGGVEHQAPPAAVAQLAPGDAASIRTAEPRTAEPQTAVGTDRSTEREHGAADAEEVARAISDFQTTAQRDGFAAALRTYARNDGFRYLVDHELPLVGPGPASRYLTAHPVKLAAWRELARGHSQDWTLAYSVGELLNAKQRGTAAYLQVWQYDHNIATWALRLLLVSPLPPAKT